MLHLAKLDDLQPATLDPAIWSANLAALATVQPELAQTLAATPLPEHWRPAIALDGFVTYRIEPPATPPAWLGQSAAPLLRARSRLARFDPCGKNPALPTCAAGAEVDFLLGRLAPHMTLFVFEADIRALAAVLHAHDWSSAIGERRCIFVPPADEEAFLRTLLESHPALLPPGDILLPALAPPDRAAELRAMGEKLHRDIVERRKRT